MHTVIYSMSVSLDGFIAGPDGDISWAAPDQELMRFHVQQTREIGAHLLAASDRTIELELLETRTFGSRVVYLRYLRGPRG